MVSQPIKFCYPSSAGPAIPGELIVSGVAFGEPETFPWINIQLPIDFVFPETATPAVVYIRNVYAGTVIIGPQGFGKLRDSAFPPIRQIITAPSLPPYIDS